MPDAPPTTSATGPVSSLIALPSVRPGPDRTRPGDDRLGPSSLVTEAAVARVHHAAIGTRDVEASLVFWRDGLGFEVLMDHCLRRSLARALRRLGHDVALGLPRRPRRTRVGHRRAGRPRRHGAARRGRARTGGRILPPLAVCRPRRRPAPARPASASVVSRRWRRSVRSASPWCTTRTACGSS